MATKVAEAQGPRSVRGRRLHDITRVEAIDLIPVPPGGNAMEATGAYAYYIRPEGATIKDALICYPNGGTPDIDDVRMRGRYGADSVYHQQRMERKGFEYIGSSLNEAGMRRLVEVLASNRDDEILFCEDEIASAKEIAASSDIPEVRAQQKRRARQLTARMEQLLEPLDVDALLEELNDIARAQQLARVDPNVLRVMRSMIGEVNDRMASAIARFQAGDGAMPEGGIKTSRAGAFVAGEP